MDRFMRFQLGSGRLWLGTAVVMACLCLGLAGRGSAAPAPRAGGTAQSSVSLLTDVCKLAREVPPAEVARWKRLLQHPAHLSAGRAARLHLWLGEIEIARNREPERAIEQFRQAMRLARRTDPVYGCAAYDRAFTLYMHGAYALSDSGIPGPAAAGQRPGGLQPPELRAHVSPCGSLRGLPCASTRSWASQSRRASIRSAASPPSPPACRRTAGPTIARPCWLTAA